MTALDEMRENVFSIIPNVMTELDRFKTYKWALENTPVHYGEADTLFYKIRQIKYNLLDRLIQIEECNT